LIATLAPSIQIRMTGRSGAGVAETPCAAQIVCDLPLILPR